MKFTRNHLNCNLWNYSSYPRLTETGIVDDDKAKPTSSPDPTPVPTPVPTPDPKCKDISDTHHSCLKSWCGPKYIVEDYCQKTCNPACDDGGDDGCPGGTTLCPDGICRHEHVMC